MVMRQRTKLFSGPVVRAYGLPVHGYISTVVKRYATGKGKPDKPSMTAWARKTCGKCWDDNEADALAVLHLHLSQAPA